MGWLDGLFGAPASTVLPTTPRTDWPSAEDVALSRQYNTSYGQAVAPYVQPAQPDPKPVAPPPTVTAAPTKKGMPKAAKPEPKAFFTLEQPPAAAPPPPSNYSGLLQVMPNQHVMLRAFDNVQDGQPTGLTPQPMPDAVADQVTQQYLAARRSAISTLGFDPSHMATGVGDGAKGDYTLGGMYVPSQDQVMTTGVYPSTGVHEAFHRGIEVLRKAGMLPPPPPNAYGLNGVSAPGEEEITVRALMQKHLGMVEKGRGNTGDAQVGAGTYQLNNHKDQLDALEAAAANYLAKQRPGGPR